MWQAMMSQNGFDEDETIHILAGRPTMVAAMADHQSEVGSGNVKVLDYMHLGRQFAYLQPWRPCSLFPIAYLPEAHNIPRAANIEEVVSTISYWNMMGESDLYLGGAARRCASIHGGSDFTVMELQISIVDDRLCFQSIFLPFVSRLKEIRGLQGITMLCRSHHIAFGLADV
ncbi:hypothetical protein Tco_1367067 [Tanacetum coccineum]